jgi:hypothetical protein
MGGGFPLILAEATQIHIVNIAIVISVINILQFQNVLFIKLMNGAVQKWFSFRQLGGNIVLLFARSHNQPLKGQMSAQH